MSKAKSSKNRNTETQPVLEEDRKTLTDAILESFAKAMAPRPVKMIALKDGCHVEVRGLPSFSSQDVFHASDRIDIEHNPMLRIYRLTVRDHKGTATVADIHESWCSSVPDLSAAEESDEEEAA